MYRFYTIALILKCHYLALRRLETKIIRILRPSLAFRKFKTRLDCLRPCLKLTTIIMMACLDCWRKWPCLLSITSVGDPRLEYLEGVEVQLWAQAEATRENDSDKVTGLGLKTVQSLRDYVFWGHSWVIRKGHLCLLLSWWIAWQELEKTNMDSRNQGGNPSSLDILLTLCGQIRQVLTLCLWIRRCCRASSEEWT